MKKLIEVIKKLIFNGQEDNFREYMSFEQLQKNGYAYLLGSKGNRRISGLWKKQLKQSNIMLDISIIFLNNISHKSIDKINSLLWMKDVHPAAEISKVTLRVNEAELNKVVVKNSTNLIYIRGIFENNDKKSLITIKLSAHKISISEAEYLNIVRLIKGRIVQL